MLEHFKFPESAHQADAEDDDPAPVARSMAGRGRAPMSEKVYPDHRRVLRRSRQDLQEGDPRASPTPAAAICSSTRCSSRMLCDPEQRKAAAAPAATIRTSWPGIYGDSDQRGARRTLPADMTITMHLCRGNFRSTFVGSGRLRADRRDAVQQDQRARLFHGVRHRARRRLRAAALPAEGQERGARAGHLEDPASSSPRTRSSGASTRRRSSRRSISSACRRNAASPRPRRATSSPRTSSGGSCGTWSRSPKKCGDEHGERDPFIYLSPRAGRGRVSSEREKPG